MAFTVLLLSGERGPFNYDSSSPKLRLMNLNSKYPSGMIMGMQQCHMIKAKGTYSIALQPINRISRPLICRGPKTHHSHRVGVLVIGIALIATLLGSATTVEGSKNPQTPADKATHAGFIAPKRPSFLLRLQPFSCFSRAIALWISLVSSK